MQTGGWATEDLTGGNSALDSQVLKLVVGLLKGCLISLGCHCTALRNLLMALLHHEKDIAGCSAQLINYKMLFMI